MLLADVSLPVTMPDKMPETAGDAIIWVAVALIVLMAAVVWVLIRRDNSKEIVNIFAKSMDDSQKTFKDESKESREAHATSIDKLIAASAAVHEKMSLTLEKTLDNHGRQLEKSVDRITSSLDDLKGKPRPRPKQLGD